MEDDKIVYSLTVDDLRNVADETIGRELSDHEVEMIENNLYKFINWYDAICNTIDYLNIE